MMMYDILCEIPYHHGLNLEIWPNLWHWRIFITNNLNRPIGNVHLGPSKFINRAP